MNITSLIAKLEALRAEHGDRPVLAWSHRSPDALERVAQAELLLVDRHPVFADKGCVSPSATSAGAVVVALGTVHAGGGREPAPKPWLVTYACPGCGLSVECLER